VPWLDLVAEDELDLGGEDGVVGLEFKEDGDVKSLEEF
jgi:hypothetical protein